MHSGQECGPLPPLPSELHVLQPFSNLGRGIENKIEGSDINKCKNIKRNTENIGSHTYTPR